MTDARRPARAPLTWPGQPRCRFCGVVMDANTAASRNNVCKAPDCDAERTREASAAIIQRDWDGYREKTRARVAQSAPALIAAAATLEDGPDDVAIVVVPRLGRPLARRDPADLRAFAEHLDRIIGEAFATDVPDGDTTRRDRLEAPEPGFASAACATCEGFCCRDGGAHFAYLNVETIRTWRRHHPDAGAGEARAAWLSRLPEVTVEGSCHYHGPEGCTLERDQRADICNRHYCMALLHLLNDASIDRDGPFVLLAVGDEGAPAVSTWSPERGWRPRPATGDAIGPDERDALAGKVLGAMPATSPMARNAWVAPPRRTCRWCGTGIDASRAATTGSCGAAPCERQRVSELYRTERR